MRNLIKVSLEPGKGVEKVKGKRQETRDTVRHTVRHKKFKSRKYMGCRRTWNER